MKKQFISIAVVLFLSTVFSFVLFKTSVTEFMRNDLLPNPYNNWEEELEYGETTGANEWARQENSMIMDPNTGEIPVHLAYEEYKRILYQRGVDPSQIYWQERGPINVGGRTRAVMFDPNDPIHRKLWAGGVTGGLWYNDNPQGPFTEWKQVSDLWENLAISCFAYDPTNTQIFYVGTGEGWFGNPDGIPGLGIWKSVNGGVSWEHLNSTYTNNDFRHVQKIVVHPANGYVYAATRSNGVMRSTDEGVNWQDVLNTTTPYPSISYRAADLEITANGEILAAMGFWDKGDGVYISATGNPGDWTRLNDGSNIFPTAASGIRRIELAVAPSNADIIYAVVQDSGNVNRTTVFDSDIQGIYKSTDKGITWVSKTIPILRICADGKCGDDVGNDGDTIFFSATQTLYDLAIAVDPNNPEVLLVGGVSLHLSTDGGDHWSKIEGIHDDHHAIVFHPEEDDLVFNGTDGGVYSVSLYPIDVDDYNYGYRVTQFHGCALHPVWGVDYMLGGAQDNGSWKFDTPGMNDTKFCIGGDGGYCYIFKNNPSYQIVSTQYDRFFLSTDNGAQFLSIYESGGTADLISPWDYDESTNNIYAAYDERNIFILNNATTEPVVYQTCYSSIVGHNNLFYNKATAFKVSPFVDSTVFVGTNSGELFKLTYAFDTLNCVIEPLTGPFQGSGRRLNCIEFGSSENQIIVVFSNYGIPSVWETLDGGASWKNKEGDLPNVPIYWAIYNPLDNRQVLLATELGVYTSEDITVISPHWIPVNNGLPIIRTTMLKVRESDNLVIASTYGRGIYSTYSFFVSPSTKILASDGEEGDAFSNSVATNGDFAIVGAPEEDEKGNNAGAVYIYEQLNNQWTESAKVLAPDGAAGDEFGGSVDMFGDLAIVGARLDDPSGSAYIYRLSGNTWNLEQKITPNDGSSGDNFGISISIVDDEAAVGASGSGGKGAVYIFKYQSGNWIQTDKIIAADGVDGDNFGYSIDLYGNYLIVGNPQDDMLRGSAYIYQDDNGWTLDKKITADDGNDSHAFGQSVAIYQQNAVVGTPYADGKPGILSPGAAYVFYNSVSSNWEQTAKLWAPDAWTFQRFGQSVSVYEDYIMVGAPLDYELDFPAGAAYVYKRESSTNWLRQNKLFASDGESGVWFGSAVNLYGTAAIVASIFDNDNGAGSGSAYIFNNIVNATNLPILSVTPPSVNTTSAQNTTSIQINNNGPGDMNWIASSFDPWLQIVGDSSGTNSGTITVNVNENLYCPRNGRIIVRAPGALHSPREVFIHQQPGSNSNEVNITPPDLNAYDQFSWSVDVDGECAIVGAPQDSEFEPYSGAAYIFERDGCCSWVQKAKLRQSNPEDHDKFGWSVALSGDVALVSKWRVGFVAYIFEKPSGGWQDMTETAKLIYSESSFTEGISVDISGKYAIVGVGEQNSIFIYERPAGGWQDMTEDYYHAMPPNNGFFGTSVAIDGNYAVVGNNHDNSQSGGGAAYVFKLDWNWGYQTRIIPSDGQNMDQFGASVDIKGNRIIVGSSGKAAAYIFLNKSDGWTEEQKLIPPPGGSHFASGIECVSIDGKYALVGAYANLDTLYNSGSAFSFIRNDLGWSFSKQIFSSDIHEEDRFGASVCLSGPYTIIGAYHKENSLGSEAGAAYIYCTEGDIVTSVSTPPEQTLPISYDLKQNYPNPFNPITTIIFDLPKPTNVTLKIYTILGEEVTTLVSEELMAGTHKYMWNPVSLASGVYLYRIESKEFTVTKKMVYLK